MPTPAPKALTGIRVLPDVRLPERGQMMKLECPDCGHENKRIANFCGWCGRRLASAEGRRDVDLTKMERQVLEQKNTDSWGKVAEILMIVFVLICMFCCGGNVFFG